MDDFDRLALAAAREVMQNQQDTSEDSHLRAAAQLVLNMASEQGWIPTAGDETKLPG